MRVRSGHEKHEADAGKQRRWAGTLSLRQQRGLGRRLLRWLLRLLLLRR